MTDERGIIFSEAMVQRLMDGSKTQTRRVMNPQPTNCGLLYLDGKQISDGEYYVWAQGRRITESWEGEKGGMVFDSPYGHVGSRLWVRESWAVEELMKHPTPENPRWVDTGELSLQYQAGPEWGKSRGRRVPRPEGFKLKNECQGATGGADGTWRPSIHMYRWASRILLEITDLRVERVQSISDSDAIAEGIEPLFNSRQIATVVGLESYRNSPVPWKNYLWHGNEEIPNHLAEGYSSADSARDSYRTLWQSINHKKHPWSENAWVWVVEFKVLEVKDNA